MTRHRGTRGYDTVKRVLDMAAASAGIILSSPIQLAVAIAVGIKLGRPVLFRQDRPGKDGVIFKLYKFRTMKDVDEAAGLLTDEQRLTPFGVALRSTSLDELPSLWNVLKGDMSIVGPRPLLVRYLEKYTPAQARRHEVRPGVTGLAQVSGRNAISWDDKFACDVEYVKARSARLDARILLRTVESVFRRHGVTADGEATMGEFTGAEQPHSVLERDSSAVRPDASKVRTRASKERTQ